MSSESVVVSFQCQPLIQEETPTNGHPRSSIPMNDTGTNIFFDTIVAHSRKNDVLLPEIERLISTYWESEDEINLANANDPDQQWTSLHFAAYLKNAELVRLLSDHPKINLMARDEENDTPLHVASYWDHTEIIEIFLTKSREKNQLEVMINAQNDKMDTPFSYAASRFHTDTCKLMLDVIPPLTIGMEYKDDESKRSREFAKLPNREHVDKFLEKNEPLLNFHQKTKHESSVINILISKLPHLVQEILNKSIMETKIASLDNDGEKRKHENTYRIVLDFGCLESHVDLDNSDDADRYEQVGAVYQPGVYKYGENPLQVMIKEQRSDLLKHPVVDALISKKWEGFARTFFYSITFMFYILFFTALLIYELFQIRPFIHLSSGETVKARIENSENPCGETDAESCYSHKSLICIISGYVVLVMSSTRLFLYLLDLLNETIVKTVSTNLASRIDMKTKIPYSYLQLFKGLKNYFTSPNNVLELLLYSQALFFSLNIFDAEVMSPVCWQIGAFCVFLSFVNLLLILQVVPGVGLYIIMFLRILRTFLSKIAALLIFFIFLFVVIFNMLLSQSPVFNNFLSGDSVYKTVSQGVSGIEAEDYDDSFSYPEASLAGLIAFAIFVQVLFLNLATGLAIEDVKEIREEAEAEMSGIKIDHIYRSEKILFTAQSIFNNILPQESLRLLPCQKRFQNMPTNKFKLEKIQSVREARENVNKKWDEIVNCNERETGFENELEQLKNELNVEFMSVRDFLRKFEKDNTNLEEELCGDVTTLLDRMEDLDNKNIRNGRDVEKSIKNLDYKIDELSVQNNEFLTLIQDIKRKCSKGHILLEDTPMLLSEESLRYTRREEEALKSVAPSDYLKLLASLPLATEKLSGAKLGPESKIQKLGKELKAKLATLRCGIERLSENTEQLRGNVLEEISNVKQRMRDFAVDNETQKSHLKRQVINVEEKIKSLLENNEVLRNDMLYILDNIPTFSRGPSIGSEISDQ